MSARIPTLAVASEYIRHGINVIPIRLDGSKRNAIPTWKEYQSRVASDDELRQWFSRPAGIGIICGAVSGHLEVLDFDEDADETFHARWNKLSPATRGKLTVCETGGLVQQAKRQGLHLTTAEAIRQRRLTESVASEWHKKAADRLATDSGKGALTRHMECNDNDTAR